MIADKYFKKYLKYKNKYIQLKNKSLKQQGGAFNDVFGAGILQSSWNIQYELKQGHNYDNIQQIASEVMGVGSVRNPHFTLLNILLNDTKMKQYHGVNYVEIVKEALEKVISQTKTSEKYISESTPIQLDYSGYKLLGNTSDIFLKKFSIVYKSTNNEFFVGLTQNLFRQFEESIVKSKDKRTAKKSVNGIIYFYGDENTENINNALFAIPKFYFSVPLIHITLSALHILLTFPPSQITDLLSNFIKFHINQEIQNYHATDNVEKDIIRILGTYRKTQINNLNLLTDFELKLSYMEARTEAQMSQTIKDKYHMENYKKLCELHPEKTIRALREMLIYNKDNTQDIINLIIDKYDCVIDETLNKDLQLEEKIIDNDDLKRKLKLIITRNAAKTSATTRTPARTPAAAAVRTPAAAAVRTPAAAAMSTAAATRTPAAAMSTAAAASYSRSVPVRPDGKRGTLPPDRPWCQYPRCSFKMNCANRHGDCPYEDLSTGCLNPTCWYEHDRI